MTERLAIVGSGAIACGLAATAARHRPVRLLARSEGSAKRARDQVERARRRVSRPVAVFAQRQGPKGCGPSISTI